MTAKEKRAIELLRGCNFVPGSFLAYFANRLWHKLSREEGELTDEERAGLWGMLWENRDKVDTPDKASRELVEFAGEVMSPDWKAMIRLRY